MSLYDTIPLARHHVFSTGDAREARARVAALVCPHTLRILGDARSLDLAWHRATLGEVTLHWFRYGVDAAVATAVRACYLVEIPVRGTGVTRCGRRVTNARPGRGLVISPQQALEAEFAGDCAKLLLAIPETTLRQRLRAIIGTQPSHPLAFEPEIDFAKEPAATLHRTLEFVLGEAQAQATLHAAGHGRQLEELLLWTLLVAQPNNFSEAIAARGQGVEPPWLQAAVAHLRAHCREPLSVAGLARAAGVGERELVDGFRRYRGTTPRELVRELRFQGVREALIAAAPGETTVAQLAMAWGFEELGRFAVDYRRRYGEPPSATLRRTPPA